MALRVFLALILLVSACTLPVVLTILVGLLCIVLFEDFYEIIPIFFINDVLYGAPEGHYFHFSYVMSLVAIIFVLGSRWLRKHLFESTAHR